MKNIQIITDSSADLSKELVEKYGIDVVPFYVSFSEETYLKEGEDLVIVANKYKCNPNYTLVYEWYRYDILDGGKSYKNTKIEGTTGNVLTIKDHKNTDETN